MTALMLRIILLVAGFVFLNSCIPSKVWYKPDASEGEREQELAKCETYADTIVSEDKLIDVPEHYGSSSVQTVERQLVAKLQDIFLLNLASIQGSSRIAFGLGEYRLLQQTVEEFILDNKEDLGWLGSRRLANELEDAFEEIIDTLSYSQYINLAWRKNKVEGDIRNALRGYDNKAPKVSTNPTNEITFAAQEELIDDLRSTFVKAIESDEVNSEVPLRLTIAEYEVIEEVLHSAVYGRKVYGLWSFEESEMEDDIKAAFNRIGTILSIDQNTEVTLDDWEMEAGIERAFSNYEYGIERHIRDLNSKKRDKHISKCMELKGWVLVEESS